MGCSLVCCTTVARGLPFAVVLGSLLAPSLPQDSCFLGPILCFPEFASCSWQRASSNSSLRALGSHFVKILHSESVFVLCPQLLGVWLGRELWVGEHHRGILKVPVPLSPSVQGLWRRPAAAASEDACFCWVWIAGSVLYPCRLERS